MLLSQRVDPSEPVCRILGAAILTFQKSDCTLDRPTFGVEPGSRRMVSQGYVLQWCKTIVSISNCYAVEIEKLRGRHTCVVFLILPQKFVRQYCTKLLSIQFLPSPHSPRCEHRTRGTCIRNSHRHHHHHWLNVHFLPRLIKALGRRSTFSNILGPLV